MKFILLTLAAFALSIAALHAQVIDPAVQAAVDAAVPAQYAGYTSLILIALMMLGRGIKALQNDKGIKGFFLAIWSGTNTPHILIACLCMLTMSSCSTMKKIGAALTTTKAKQVELALVDVGLHVALADGVITPGDAITIGNGVAVITSGASTVSKVVALGDLGLKAAVNKGLVKPGDALLIKDSTAVITAAITTPAPLTLPPAPPAIVGPLPAAASGN